MNKSDKKLEEVNDKIKDIVRQHPEICNNPSESINKLHDAYHGQLDTPVDRGTSFNHISDVIMSACKEHSTLPSKPRADGNGQGHKR